MSLKISAICMMLIVLVGIVAAFPALGDSDNLIRARRGVYDYHRPYVGYGGYPYGGHHGGYGGPGYGGGFGGGSSFANANSNSFSSNSPFGGSVASSSSNANAGSFGF